MSEFNYQRANGQNYTDEDIKRIIKERNVKFIKLQFVDINGQVKNLSIPASHIDRVLANDIMLDGSSIKGFRSIETSDMFFYPDKNTFQILPWQERDGKNSARLICDIYNADGTTFKTGFNNMFDAIREAGKNATSTNKMQVYDANG